jgi:hypothetical protein
MKSVFEKLTDKYRSRLRKKVNFPGISRHEMFKTIKYLFIYISEQRRVLGHYLTKFSVYSSPSPHIYPIHRHVNKTYKNMAMSNRLNKYQNIIHIYKC